MSSRSSNKQCSFCGLFGHCLKSSQRIHLVGNENQVALLNSLFGKDSVPEVEACSVCNSKVRHAVISKQTKTANSSKQSNFSTGIY